MFKKLSVSFLLSLLVVTSFLISFMGCPSGLSHARYPTPCRRCRAMCGRMSALLPCAGLLGCGCDPPTRRKRSWRGRDGAPGIVVSIES